MKEFLEKYAGRIAGSVSCFDRIIFKGHLPISWPEGMESFLRREKVLIKDFKRYVTQVSQREVALFAAVLRGEHALHGFTSRELLRMAGISPPTDPVRRRRLSAKMYRRLNSTASLTSLWSGGKSQ